MLKVIGLLNAGTIRGLLVAIVPLVVLIGSLFGLDQAVFQASLDGWVEKAVAIVAALGVAYAAYGRIFNPTPPLTETAAAKTAELLKKQGGRAHVGMLLMLAACATAFVGCANMNPFAHAKTPLDHAHVALRSLETAQEEALVLVRSPSIPDAAKVVLKKASQDATVAATELGKATIEVEQIRGSLVAGASAEVRLRTATENMVKWTQTVKDCIASIKHAIKEIS